MKIIRCLAAVGVIAGASLWSAPAQAHHSIEFETCEASGLDIGPFLSPSPGGTPTPTATPAPAPTDCIPEEGSVIRETRELRFRVTENSPILELDRGDVRVSVLGDEEVLADVDVPLEPSIEDVSNSEAVVDVTWDSRAATPRNGRYKLLLEADASSLQGPHTVSEEVADLRVDNPPVTPAAPAIAAVTSSSVTVQWAAAPEPDVQNYILFRAVTDDDTAPAPSSFDLVTTTTEETSYRDSNVQTGKSYWYMVQVRRRSVVEPELGSWSAFSPISGAGTVGADDDDGDGDGDGDGGDGLAGQDGSDDGDAVRPIPFRRVTSSGGGGSNTPDAPFTYSLPFDDENAVPEGDIAEPSEPGGDPRGPVLPVAVGAFLLSTALTFGRMPY